MNRLVAAALCLLLAACSPHGEPSPAAPTPPAANSVHLTATGAGRGIQVEAPGLVVQAVTAVVDALGSTGTLPACTEFAAVGGECFRR